MDNSKFLALLGALLIAVGVFMPLYVEDTPGGEERTNFWDFDEGNNLEADGVGVYLLAVVLVAALLVLVDRAEYVWLPVMIVVWYLIFQLPPLWGFYRNDVGVTPGTGWALLTAGTVLLSAPLLWPAKSLTVEHNETASDVVPDAGGFSLLRVLNWAGLILLVGGFFVPLAKINGQLSFYPSGTSNGYLFTLIVLVLAGVALALRKSSALWVAGLLALLVVSNDLRLTLDTVDNASGAEMRWGWLLLFDGAVVLILTFFLGEDRKHVAGVFKAFFATEIDLDAEDEDENDAEQDSPEAA